VCAEKTLKALLASRGVDYPLTHDLRNLLVLAVGHFPVLEKFRESLPRYTVYAVAMRYDATMSPAAEEVQEARDTVKCLRAPVCQSLSAFASSARAASRFDLLIEDAAFASGPGCHVGRHS